MHIHIHIHIHIRTRVCWQAAHLSHIHLEHMRTTCNTPQHTLARRAPVTHTPKALQHNEHTVNTRKCMRARVTGARLAKARGREGMALRDFTSHEASRCVCVCVGLSVCLSVCLYTYYISTYIWYRGTGRPPRACHAAVHKRLVSAVQQPDAGADPAPPAHVQRLLSRSGPQNAHDGGRQSRACRYI